MLTEEHDENTILKDRIYFSTDQEQKIGLIRRK